MQLSLVTLLPKHSRILWHARTSNIEDRPDLRKEATELLKAKYVKFGLRAIAYAAEKEAVKNGPGVIDVDAAKAPRPRSDAAATSAFTDESSSDDEDVDVRVPLPPTEKHIAELPCKELEAEF